MIVFGEKISNNNNNNNNNNKDISKKKGNIYVKESISQLFFMI